MPFIEEQGQSPLERYIPEEERKDFSFREKLQAAAELDGVVGARLVREEGLPDERRDFRYSAWDDLTEMEKTDEAFVDAAIMSDSFEELKAVRRQWETESLAREKMTGIDGALATLSVGVLSPINLIPVGGTAYRAFKVGDSLLKNGLLTASVAGSTMAAEEWYLHQQQLQRTYGESATAITAASLLGLALGSGAAALSRKQFKAAEEATERMMSPDTRPFTEGLEIDEAAVKAELMREAKLDLFPKMADKLSRVQVKALKSELSDLQKRLSDLRDSPPDISGFDKKLPARKKKQLAQEQAAIDTQRDSRILEERIGKLEADLSRHNAAAVAEADLSRLEQGILPPEYQRTLNDVLREQEAPPEVQIKDSGQAPSPGQQDADEIPLPSGTRSMGAAETIGAVKIKGKVAEQLAKRLGFSPLTRVLTRASDAAKKFLVQLVENPIDVEGYSGQAVESLAKSRRDGLLFRGLTAHREIYKEYKKSGGKLTRKEFNAAVSKEQRNPGTTDPHIKRSAQAIEAEIYAPQRKAMQEMKLLKEELNVKTSDQYLNRMWNKHKVGGNLPRFIDITSAWLRRIQPKLDQEDAETLASEIASTIMGTPEGILSYDHLFGKLVSGKLKSPFQPRVFDIEDELVEEFLENDIEKLAGAYLRQTSADIEIVRKFGDDKTPPSETIQFKPQMEAISTEYRNKMEMAKTEKERLALQKEMNATLSDFKGMIDRMRGVYGMPDPSSLAHRIMGASRNWAYLRFMGGVTISSLSDMARVVMAEGMVRSFGTLMRPMIKGLKESKVASDDIRWHGVGTDAITGGRLEVISDINDYALGNTAFERGMQSAANSFGVVNLLNQWTGLMKVTHGVAMQARVMDELGKGVYNKSLSRLGISEDMAFDIYKQVKKHGRKDGNAWIYNAKDWDDPNLALQWGAALKKESDRVIVVPGQDKPLFMSTEAGKTLFQFRSFQLAATQRILISGIQGQDQHLVQGLLGMVTFGMMTYALKQLESGRELSDDPRVWVMEGIDRSGAVGILMEINNTVEKVSSNNLGVRPLIGLNEPSSRFASRSQVEAFLGPTYGSSLSTTMGVLNAASSDYDWGESDTRSLRRLLPYQNLSGLRIGLDQVEKAANDLIVEN